MPLIMTGPSLHSTSSFDPEPVAVCAKSFSDAAITTGVDASLVGRLVLVVGRGSGAERVCDVLLVGVGELGLGACEP